MKKLGDMPTMKIEPGRFAEFARREDSRVREETRGEAALRGAGSTTPREETQGQPSSPDIEVSVQFLEDPLGREVPTAVRRSDMLPVARELEGSSLEAVPVIAVGKDDLAWFEFEADTHVLLRMIDGHTSVREILTSVAIPPARALELLRDLERQRVIALG